MSINCDIQEGYSYNAAGQCVYQIFTFNHFVGSILIAVIAGLSSLAGLGGGGPSIVVYILCFDLFPKDATIIVFASILGSSFGNLINQMQKAYNGKPIINYEFAFITLPIMFVGAFFGIMLNHGLPSIFIASIIIITTGQSLNKIYNSFLYEYAEETKAIQQHKQSLMEKQLIQQTQVNPFQSDKNLTIFKHLSLLVLIYFVISSIRGSEKFPSLFEIQTCSISYWFFQLLLLGNAFFWSIKNQKTVEILNAPTQNLNQEIQEKEESIMQKNNKQVMIKSFMAGIFSGFGLGGGLFLVPMYKLLGLTSLQATASCTFSIFITAFINCLQAVTMGILSIHQFLIYFSMATFGSYFISKIISSELRKRNRLSYVELLLLLLLVTATICLPISIWLKYVASGRDLQVIFGFGSLC